jgi:peptidoglycan/xylan/chitin deacetylase (PgdA/CDA1 family)
MLSTKLLCKAGLARPMLRPNDGAPVILLYLGVTKLRHDSLVNSDSTHVALDAFRRHLEMVIRSRRVVSLEELIDGLREGYELNGAIAITFDDGCLDNSELAASALSDRNWTASFFLAIGSSGTNRWAWVDHLEAAFAGAAAAAVNISLLGGRVPLCGSIAQRTAILARVKAVLKTLPRQMAEARAQEVAAELAASLEHPYCVCRPVSWQDARQLSRAGFEIGAHTVNHALLSRVPIAEAQREIIASRAKMLAELGTCSRTFCFPNGKRSDYAPTAFDFCREHFSLRQRRSGWRP